MKLLVIFSAVLVLAICLNQADAAAVYKVHNPRGKASNCQQKSASPYNYYHFPFQEGGEPSSGKAVFQGRKFFGGKDDDDKKDKQIVVVYVKKDDDHRGHGGRPSYHHGGHYGGGNRWDSSEEWVYEKPIKRLRPVQYEFDEDSFEYVHHRRPQWGGSKHGYY